MSDDDSRGNESPDRHDAQPSTTDEPIRTHLESLDELTRLLLEALHDPATEIDDEPIPDQTRREARRRCREIRAETAQIGLLCYGPDASIPYYPSGRDRTTAGVTSYSGPDPDAVERDHHRCGDGPDDTAADRDQFEDTDDPDDTHNADDTDGGETDD